MTGNWKAIIRTAALGLALALAILASAQKTAQGPVSASVQEPQVVVGDPITYLITITTTAAGQSPSVAVPIINPDTGLSTPEAAGSQTSQQIYNINGQARVAAQTTYLYTIQTSKEGRFVIPPATVTLGGKSYETEPVEVLVQAVPEAKNLPQELKGLVVAPQVRGNPELQRKLTGAVFVMPVLSNNNPYNGEQVRIAYHLVIDPKALQAAGLLLQTNLDGVSEPAMSDFIKEVLFPFPQDIKFQEREFDGHSYLLAPVYEAVITSTKTGPLTIEPFKISMIFMMRNQRGFSAFQDDPFFGPGMGMMPGNGLSVVAQSPQLALDVKPVPTAGRPADFSGAVGTFKVTAEVDKKQAKAYDDTIQLDVTISGQGNTESLSPPKLTNLSGFTVLGEPEQQTSGRKVDKDYISQKKFSYTLRPTTPGKQTIPEIGISAFEPKLQEFVPVHSDPIEITVAPGTRPVPSTPAPEPDQADTPEEVKPAPVENDYRYIYTGELPSPRLIDRLFSAPLVYGMFMAPLGLLAAAGLVAWGRRRAGSRVEDKRRRAIAGSSQHLRQAHAAIAAGNSQDAFAQLSDGIRLHFAAKFDMPVAEVTIPEIEERLAARGIPHEMIGRLSTVLENCDTARYAPGARMPEARRVYDEADELLRGLEAYFQ